MNEQIAQVRHNTPGLIKGLGPLGDLNESPLVDFENVISMVIGTLTIVAGLWFIFILITGAIAYMNAGGDKAAVEEAKKKITTGLIGITLVVAAMFIADLLGYIVGIDLFNVKNSFLNSI